MAKHFVDTGCLCYIHRSLPGVRSDSPYGDKYICVQVGVISIGEAANENTAGCISCEVRRRTLLINVCTGDARITPCIFGAFTVRSDDLSMPTPSVFVHLCN